MGERCIAGIELLDGKPVSWIRPVSRRPHEELSPRERQFANGEEPRLLDIMVIPLIGPNPKDYQHENWLIKPHERWLRVGTYSWDNIVALVNPHKPLWVDNYHTQHGQNDHVPIQEAQQLDHSLRLVRVNRLHLRVFKVFYRPTVQAHFSFAGMEYRLKVTDPAIEQAYIHEEGEYELGESCLTISLGEPFNDCCYKLVAAVIPKPL